MKLTGIAVENWLYHRRMQCRITPLSIICGPNESGKSSLQDAIAFGILADLRRVDAKGDRKQLVTEGAEEGSVSLTFKEADGTALTITRDVESGKLVKSGKIPTVATSLDGLPFTLDHTTFSRLTVDERRATLLKMMGVEITTEAVLKELTARGRNTKLLGAAFKHGLPIEKWHEQAGIALTESRGAWKQITGETYGSKKAVDWAPPPPEPVTDETFSAAEDAVRQANADLSILNRSLGAIEQQEKFVGTGPDSVLRFALESEANRLDDAKEARATKAQETFGLQLRCNAAELALAEVKGRLPGAAPEYCPHCKNGMIRQNGVWECYFEPDNPSTPGEVAEAQDAYDVLFTELRDLKASLRRAEDFEQRAEEAKAKLAAMEEPQPATTSAGAPPDLATQRRDVEGQIAQTNIELKNAESALEVLKAQRARIADAAERTRKAGDMHRRIVAWQEIQEDLAPSGIPQMQLATAIQPLNDQLRDLAAAFKWRQPRLSDSMMLAIDGRRYSLCSESTQWRADALIAIAIAIITKLRIVVIDRFDVLEPALRSPAMGAFYNLTRKGILDTCILLAATKAPISPVPPDVAVTWLGEPIETRAAA